MTTYRPILDKNMNKRSRKNSDCESVSSSDSKKQDKLISGIVKLKKPHHFRVWRFGVERYLKKKRLFKYIEKPALYASEETKLDIISALIRTTSSELHEFILAADTPAAAWKSLEQKFIGSQEKQAFDALYTSMLFQVKELKT